MRKIMSLLLVLMICFNLPHVLAQETPERAKIYIKLSFDANSDDTGLKNEVKRYIKRELRQLGDIVFSDEDYKFELSFFVFEPKTKSGERTDIVVISVIVTEPLPDGRPLFVGDTFRACSRNDIPEVCGLMIAQIDNELINKERKID